MHAVRTPVFGIGFAIVLLVLETLGARAYISDRMERQAQVDEPVSDCTAFGYAPDTSPATSAQ